MGKQAVQHSPSRQKKALRPLTVVKVKIYSPTPFKEGADRKARSPGIASVLGIR
jgi:hypothetical protein